MIFAMSKNARHILIANIKKLMIHAGIGSEAELARRTMLSQKSINNLLNEDEFSGNPRLDTIQKIASYFRVEVWKLFISDVSVDALLSRDLEKVVGAFAKIDDQGRMYMLRTADLELKQAAKSTDVEQSRIKNALINKE